MAGVAEAVAVLLSGPEAEHVRRAIEDRRSVLLDAADGQRRLLNAVGIEWCATERRILAGVLRRMEPGQ